MPFAGNNKRNRFLCLFSLVGLRSLRTVPSPRLSRWRVGLLRRRGAAAASRFDVMECGEAASFLPKSDPGTSRNAAFDGRPSLVGRNHINKYSYQKLIQFFFNSVEFISGFKWKEKHCSLLLELHVLP